MLHATPRSKALALGLLLVAGALMLVTAAQPAHAQGGLLGQYYAWDPAAASPPDRTAIFQDSALKLTRIDAQVDFNWGNDAPDPAVPADRFCARWTGTVTPPATDDYTFYIASDDGSRLWVSDKPIDPANPGDPLIDNWKDQGETEAPADTTVSMTQGRQYYIMMEYYENGGGAVARLRWESASVTKQIIPTNNLTPAKPPYPVGNLVVTVTTASGAAAGATVALSGPEGRRATADAQGKVTFAYIKPGDYSVTAYIPGSLAPATATVTVAQDQSATVSLQLSKPVVLTPYPIGYDMDWVNSADAPTDYDVVTTNPAFDKASLPASGSQVKVGSVPFTFPPTDKGAMNVVSMALNTFLFSKAHYTGLHLLACSNGNQGGGPYQGNAILTYSDGTTGTVAISVANRTSAATANETQAIAAQMLDNTGAPAGDASINYQFIPVDATKELVSVSFTTQLGSDTTASPMLWAMTTESAETPEPLSTVSGVVKVDSSPVSGAIVRLGPLQKTTTSSGVYSFVVPAGNYTLGALLAGKYAPVLNDITVAAGQKLTQDVTLGAASAQFQYPLNYSQDWVSGADAPGDYTFGDTAFIAEQMPLTNGKAQFGNITFSMGGIAEGQQNMIFVNGQVLPVPEGNYSGLYILESCVSGSYTRNWTLTYADGSTETVSVQFTDWCGTASGVEKDWVRFQGRNNPSGVTTPNCAIFYEPRFLSGFTKKLKSIALNGDPGGYATQSGGLFALTLEAAAAPATATVKGVVKGPNGPVAGASVVIGYDPNVNFQGSGYVAAVTGTDGSFTGTAPGGTYPVSIVARGSGLKPMTKTASFTAGQTTDLGTITLESYGTQVISWLGAPDINQGLRHINPKDPDSASQSYVAKAVNVAGEDGANATNFGFDVDDNFIYRGMPSPNAYIRIHYYDAGTDPINIVYNGADLSAGDGKYQITTEITTRTNTNKWMDADIALDNAGFYGTQPVGADFRISGTNLTLGYVVVSTQPNITVPSRPAPPVTVIKGDLSGDGKILVNDAVLALQFAVGLKTPTADQLAAGDLNGDGKITINEVTLVLQAAVGLRTL